MTKYVTQLFVVTLILAPLGANAIDTEYPGFQHFRNWNGRYGPKFVTVKMPISNATTLPLALSKDLCAADTRCGIFSGPWFRAFNVTPDYDMFLGIQGQTGTAPAASCDVVNGGGNFPNIKWLTCSDDLNGCGDLGPCYFLDTYQLPPDQIHKECLNNPACFGFRVNNDRQSGDILGRRTTPSSNAERYGYFKIL
jgi:hypothetical protein